MRPARGRADRAIEVDCRSPLPLSQCPSGRSGRCHNDKETAMMTIETTNADEIGFESLMPSEMPLTSAKMQTSTSAMQR